MILPFAKQYCVAIKTRVMKVVIARSGVAGHLLGISEARATCLTWLQQESLPEESICLRPQDATPQDLDIAIWF